MDPHNPHLERDQVPPAIGISLREVVPPLQHRLEVHALLVDLVRRDGLTVLVVSHDLNLAARYADRLVLLRCGTIAADGTPDQVLRPDAIREVYRVDVEIARDPTTGRPFVVPLRPTPPS